MRSGWGRLLAVAAVVVAVGAHAGPAYAATGNVYLNGTVVHYEASDDANVVTITHVGTHIIIDDVRTMTAGVGCWMIDSTKVGCADGGVTVVRVDGNGGDDRINSAMDLPVSLWGHDGDDALSGGDGNDTLRGGPGADIMRGEAGRDAVSYYGQLRAVQADLDGVADDGASGEGDLIGTDVEELYGGEGDDTLTGNSAANLLHGNGGDDYLLGYGGEDKLYGAAGNDYLNGMDDSDDVYGGDGNDRVNGGLGDDFLSGDAGNDVLQGSSGFDRLLGGEDSDELYGGADLDYMDGGPGGDICDDATTWVAVSCE